MKNKNIILLSAVIIILLVGISYSSNFLIPAMIISPGFEVDAISAPPYITPDTDLSGIWFLISTTLNGAGESIVATITPEQTKTMSGYKTKYPLSISVSPVKETVNYPIVNDGETLGGIYEYRLSYIDGWILEPDPNNCPVGTNWRIKGGFDVGGISLKTRLWCVQKILIGTKGHLESPQLKWSADISLTANGQTASQKVTRISSENPSVILSDRASASWTGSLITGDQPPIASNYVATFVTGKYWKIAYSESWGTTKYNYQITDNFFSEAQSSGTVYKSPGGITDPNWERQPTLDNYISTAKTTTNILIDQNVAITPDSVVQNAYNKDAGKVVFTPNVRITNQKVNFRVRADWIGIYFETGQPQIQTITSNKFGSGELGSIILTVKNIGDGQGTFVPVLHSCPTFYQKDSSYSLQKTVLPGTTETFKIDLLHGTVNNDVTETCMVKVYDYKNPNHYDEKSITISMTHSKICTPNQYSYDGNIIYKCNADGTARDIIKTCINGVDYKTGGEYGGYYCKEGTGTPTLTPGATPNVTYKDWTESAWLLIGILITLISGLYILTLRGNKHGKK